MTTEPDMVCSGCGTDKTLDEIRAERPTAFSCCPERKMLNARAWAERARAAERRIAELDADNLNELRETICNSIPYIDNQVVQAAMDGDFGNSPQWIWRNHENGVVGFGRWPEHPDAAPYIRADLIVDVLARMATSHALGFKAGIEAGAEAAASWRNPAAIKLAAGEMTAQELRTAQAVAGGIEMAITSLPTTPSILPEILEAMRPFAVTDTAWNGEPDSLVIELRGVDDEPQPCVHLGDIRRLVAVVTKLGGKIDE